MLKVRGGSTSADLAVLHITILHYNKVDLPADAQTFVRACFHLQPCKVMLFNLFLILCILLNKGIKHTQLGLFNATPLQNLKEVKKVREERNSNIFCLFHNFIINS